MRYPVFTMIKHAFPHKNLSLDALHNVANQAFASYKEKYPEYNPVLTWKSKAQAEVNFSAKGASIKGLLSITKTDIVIELEVPLLLRMFKNMALQKIETELNRWLAEAEKNQAQ